MPTLNGSYKDEIRKCTKAPSTAKSKRSVNRSHRQNSVQAVVILQGAQLQLLRAAIGVHSLKRVSFGELE